MAGVADTGFVKVACAKCGNPDVWLRCQTCQKADHFRYDGAVVTCDCAATYDHATCTCGAEVGPPNLAFVAWEKGPRALADLEWAWERIAALAALLLLLIGAGVWWFVR